MTDELELTHKGVAYLVEVEFDRRWEDDSFDHDWGGRRQTEVCGHWEVDPDSLEITSCLTFDSEGHEVEVDAEDVPGLICAIVEKLEAVDP